MEDTLTSSICPTCGGIRPDRFCPRCGEERVHPNEYTVRRFLHRTVQEDSPLHGRTVRTLAMLFRRPGQLTYDYLIGRRQPYISPFRVYLLISVLFFLIVPYTGLFKYTLSGYEELPLIGAAPRRMVEAELQRSGETYESYERRFNREIAGQKKTMMVFLVPLFALGMLLVFRRRHYGEHLVFSTHYFAALLLYLGVLVQLFFKLVFVLLGWLAGSAPGFSHRAASILSTEYTLLLVIFVPAVWYLHTAAVRAYGVSRRHGLLAALVLSAWQFVLILYFYRTPLFYTTFYALRF